MIARVRHVTNYAFSEEVFLEPHLLKFMPRQDQRQQVLAYSSNIRPEPEGKYGYLDEIGNTAEFAWFSGKNDQLKIEIDFKVSLNTFNIFDFLIYPFHFSELPFQYDPDSGFDNYLRLSDNQPGTHELAQKLMDQFGKKALDFLFGVTQHIHDQFRKTTRHEGPPHTPDKTLLSKAGSCRDLAVLMIEIFRKAGFASRFTSGYKFQHDEGEEHELHAWVEVFIPGAGWFGLDPSTGLAAGNDHIAVSSSFNPVHTMPVTGSFRGSASSKLETSIQIDIIK